MASNRGARVRTEMVTVPVCRGEGGAAKLPGESEEPTVNEVKMTRFDPMLVFNLSGNVPERRPRSWPPP